MVVLSLLFPKTINHPLSSLKMVSSSDSSKTGGCVSVGLRTFSGLPGGPSDGHPDLEKSRLPFPTQVVRNQTTDWWLKYFQDGHYRVTDTRNERRRLCSRCVTAHFLSAHSTSTVILLTEPVSFLQISSRRTTSLTPSLVSFYHMRRQLPSYILFFLILKNRNIVMY